MKIRYKIFLLLILFFILSIGAVNAGTISWSERYTISSDGDDDAYRARVVCDSQNNFHVVWKEKSDILNAGSDWDLFYKYRSTNDSWSELSLITSGFDSDAICLSLAIDDRDTLHLAWKDTSNVSHADPDSDIFYCCKPYGSTWSVPVLVSNQSTGECSCPEIVVDNQNTLHLTYSDSSYDLDQDPDADIMYTSKPENGSWEKSILVSTRSNMNSFGPHIAVDYKKNVHIVWYEKDDQSQDFDVYYATKNVNSINWTDSILLSSTLTGSSVDPWVESDTKNTIHVIWMDNTNLDDLGADYDVFYRYKKVGEIWSPVKCISEQSISNCKWLGMAIDANDTIYAAWSDETNIQNNGNDYDIILSYKTKNDAWSDLLLVTNHSDYESNWPRFTIDEKGIIHMTWWDRTPERWITYYQQGRIHESHQKMTNETPLAMFVSTLFLLVAFSFIAKKRKIKDNQ